MSLWNRDGIVSYRLLNRQNTAEKETVGPVGEEVKFTEFSSKLTGPFSGKESILQWMLPKFRNLNIASTGYP